VIFLSDASADFNEPIKITENLWVLPNLPIEVEGHWENWLGFIKVNAIRNSRLFIFSFADSRNPTILDEENNVLINQTHEYMNIMLLAGVIAFGHAECLSGAKINDVTQIRDHVQFQRYFFDKEMGPRLFVANDFEMVGKMLTNYKHSLLEKDKFRRINRGVEAFVKAMYESSSYYRIHQLVRALEAVIHPVGDTKRATFKNRCKYFVKQEDEGSKIFVEMYDLRGRVEHLDEFRSMVKGSEEKFITKFELRTRQLEHVTKFVYQKILLDKELMNHFANDESIADFWRRMENGGENLWIEKFDLSSVS